jgi:hypothetical protein
MPQLTPAKRQLLCLTLTMPQTSRRLLQCRLHLRLRLLLCCHRCPRRRRRLHQLRKLCPRHLRWRRLRA